MKKSLAIYGVIVVAVALAVQMGVLNTNSEISDNEGCEDDVNPQSSVLNGAKSNLNPEESQSIPAPQSNSIKDKGVISDNLIDENKNEAAVGPKVDADISITPKTIFLSSGGKFSIFISFKTEDVNEIVPYSITCEGITPVGYMVADMGNETYFMAQFNIDDIKTVTDRFKVTGTLNDGRSFEGSVDVNLLEI